MAIIFTEQELTILKQHHWNINIINEHVDSASHELEGSFIQGDFVEEFLKNKLEEIIEDAFDFDTSDIFEKNGFITICESPLEVKDPDGNLITGECAFWLKQHLIGMELKNASH